MDFLMVVIGVVLLISAESARPTKLQKRLNLLENRVNTLDAQISLESDYTQEFFGHVIDINATLKEVQSVCQCASTRKNSEIEENEIASSASNQDAVDRVLTTISQEKVKLISTADTIVQTMTEIKHNITQETDQNIQALMNDYNDLKLEVRNMNVTFIDIQDEILHYIKSDKEKTSLLSAQLKSYKENTSMLSAQLKSNTEYTSLLSAELQSNKANTALLSAQLKSTKENNALLSAELQSYKENTALLSAELKELVSRLDLIEKAHIKIEESYNEAKQIFKDTATPIDNKNKSKQCPNLWVQYGMFCYQLVTKYAMYSEAKRRCKASNAYVADIQNYSEQEFLRNLTENERHYWIGLTDIETEGSWKLDRTNSAPSFQNWMPGKPNNYTMDWDCALASYPDRGVVWIDNPCDLLMKYVCKKSL